MDEITLEAQSKMSKTVDSLKGDLAVLRTGRASPAILERIECDYYGDKIAITAISSVTVPEPRQLLIKPFDRGDLKSILAAINASNIGINPQAESDCIRLIIPPLTEDSRRDLVKKAKAMVEENKVAIRNIRRDYMDFVKDNDEMTEDYQKRVQEEIQKVHDEAMKSIDEIFQAKEKEIMSI